MEPVSARLLAATPEITTHFSRFRVTEISLSEQALGQFESAPQLKAADLLSDARVDAIAWGGTSGGWVGIETDRELCRQITERTKVPSTTSTLALLDAFASFGTKRYGLVTPYLPDVQSRIIENFRAAGFDCVCERHLNDEGNFSFSEFSEDLIASMVTEVARERPDAIAIYCTNFRGATIVDAIERETGIPVFDSVSLTIWRTMQLAGADPRRIEGWGRLFSRLSQDEPQ